MWRKVVFFAGLVLGAFSVDAVCEASIVADSVADFSGNQGQGNWHYGYVDATAGMGFIALPQFVTNYPLPIGNNPYGPPVDAWIIDAVPTPGGTLYFTALWNSGGATNGIVTSGQQNAEHWTVRRWLSEVDGQISIAGMFGDFSQFPLGINGSDQDGVEASILVDGSPIWTMGTDGHVLDAPYSATAFVSVGSTVDFVVKPRQSDYADQYTFTATIDAVPEPTSIVIWTLVAVTTFAVVRLRCQGERHPRQA